MSKIKVLVVPSDRTGVGKFRSVDPHVFLQNLYGDDFHVDIIYEPSYDITSRIFLIKKLIKINFSFSYYFTF